MKGFFFIQWGTKRGQFSLSGIKLKISVCPVCKKPTKINLIYHSKATEIYWMSGRGSIKQVQMTCLNCGKTYNVEGPLLVLALQIFKQNIRGKEKEYPDPDRLLREAQAETEALIEEKNKLQKSKDRKRKKRRK